jgi:preprotein translocase subunit SecA
MSYDNSETLGTVDHFDSKEHMAKLQKRARGTRSSVMDPKKKGRYRNAPCACGSGKKIKKCCGKGE